MVQSQTLGNNMKRLILAVAFTLMIPMFAQAETPSPYKSIDFHEVYTTRTGFNIYQVDKTEPIAKVTNRKKRNYHRLIPLLMVLISCISYIINRRPAKEI